MRPVTVSTLPAARWAVQQFQSAQQPLTDRAAYQFHWLLRLAATAEFVGHGAFGIITKAAWLPYFAVVGVPPELAYRLMPVIGTVDIALGILVFFKPVRVALLYMAFWGLLTATIRPLAGEPVWEWIERAPNFLIPFALLYLRGMPPSWCERQPLRERMRWSSLREWLD